MNRNGGKIFIGLLIGIICAVAVFCLAILIGCSVNGLTFGDQIIEWFGKTASDATDIVEETKSMLFSMM